jgi:hypothetical protein
MQTDRGLFDGADCNECVWTMDDKLINHRCSASGGEKVWCEFMLDDGTALLPCVAWRASASSRPETALRTSAGVKCAECASTEQAYGDGRRSRPRNGPTSGQWCSECGGGGGDIDAFSWVTRLALRGGVAQNRIGHFVEVP